MSEQCAKEYAERCHAAINQRRKYTDEPYIVHPAEVVELVRSVPHTEAMLCAAWLHDVVEDTHATLLGLHHMFGAEIAALVEMLTDVSVPSDGNRATRKAIDREHTARASAAAKTIKLADLISNSRSIATHDPDFAKVYFAEKRLLLDFLREGDSVLWERAYRLLPR